MTPTRQVSGDPPRRWFASPRCDLIVWLRDDETPMGFQFCYDKDVSEHALTWIEDRGFNHMRVESGGPQLGEGKGTPLLVMDGLFDPERILELFLAECELVPAPFVELVSAKLLEIVAESRRA